MKSMAKILLKGFIVILPIGLTIYVIWWLGSAAETLIAPLLSPLLPAEGLWRYRTGMGIVGGVVVVFFIGLLTYVYLFRRMVDCLNRVLERIPLAKTVYGVVRDVIDMVSQPPRQRPTEVVLLEVADNVRLLGVVTQPDPAKLPDHVGPECVAVYLPMSYQLGGYTVFVAKDRLQPVDMTIEQLMRYALTAGMSVETGGAALPKA